jgi:hypothetical protein
VHWVEKRAEKRDGSWVERRVESWDASWAGR